MTTEERQIALIKKRLREANKKDTVFIPFEIVMKRHEKRLKKRLKRLSG